MSSIYSDRDHGERYFSAVKGTNQTAQCSDKGAKTTDTTIDEARSSIKATDFADGRNLAEGRRLLAEVRAKVSRDPLRLRTFLPLLQAYSDVGDVERAFSLYEDDIVGKEQIMVGERE